MKQLIFVEPIVKKTPWGSEKWLVSAHESGDCNALGTGMSLSGLWEKRPDIFCSGKKRFPLLVKRIDAREDLSVQVHPDDTYAAAHEAGESGKSECWYVASCKSGSIAIGHNAESREELEEMVLGKRWSDLIREEPIKKGDFFQIDPGTLHAVKGGTEIIEIQQSSSVTYRVYDYDRVFDGKKRELHLEKSLDVIKCPYKKPSGVTESGVESEYYSVEKAHAEGKIKKNGFWICVVVSGEGRAEGHKIKKDDAFIVPSGFGEVLFEGGAEIMIIRAKEHYKIGVDIGGTNIAAGLVGEDKTIIRKASRPTGSGRDVSHFADDIASLCREVASERFDEVEEIGVGCPGTIDVESGEVVYSNNLDMHHIFLGEELEKRLGKKVRLENDANAAAMGEYLLSGRRSMVLITLGTGVGGGAVLDGKLYRGFNGAGFEPGHMIIQIDGEECTCGNRGCWEAYASATALIRQTKEAMAKDKSSLMHKWVEEHGVLDGRTAFECARAGDESAREAVGRYIEYLGCGLVGVVNLLQPECILIGGGLSGEGEALLQPLREYVFKRDFNKYAAKTQIKSARLGNDAGIVGAAFAAQ